jgi:hypothetical protein
MYVLSNGSNKQSKLLGEPSEIQHSTFVTNNRARGSGDVVNPRSDNINLLFILTDGQPARALDLDRARPLTATDLQGSIVHPEKCQRLGAEVTERLRGESFDAIWI